MADVGVGPLHSHLSRFRRDSGFVLCAQLDVKLCGMLSICQPPQRVTAHLDPIVQLDLSTGVHTNMLEGFSRDIIRLTTRLKGLKDSRFVDTSWRIRVQ